MLTGYISISIHLKQSRNLIGDNQISPWMHEIEFLKARWLSDVVVDRG